MKKVLALFLALLMMITTISLAACSKTDTPDDTEDDTDDGIIDLPGSQSSDSSNPSGDSSDNTQDSQQTVIPGGWTETNDTVYAGVKLNLRTSANSSGNNNIAKTVEFGTKLNRISTNGTWSKVTMDGDTQEYYATNGWLSSNAGQFTFTACEAVSLTINDTANNIIFFQTPFESEDQDLYFQNAVCASGFKLENVSEGYTLKKVATSSNSAWIKVEFVGTITINANNKKNYTTDAPGVLYVKMRSIERGDITDPTHSGGTTNPGNDALG